jgi:aerobic-type carbon monoxide dehydrogenase small subunit (CoxS/CutS family)
LAWLVTERVREGTTLLTRDEMESMVLYVLKTIDMFTRRGSNSDFHSTSPCETMQTGYLIIFLMQAKWCIEGMIYCAQTMVDESLVPSSICLCE